MKLFIEPSKRGTRLPAILKAALHLFVQKGIESTTTKEIARRAGVSEGALYRHFKGKEELAWQLFVGSLNEFTGGLTARVMSQRGARRRIEGFARECLAAFENDKDLFYYLILSEHKELRRFADRHTHPGLLMESIIKEGQKAGELRKGNPYVLVAVVFGTLHRLFLLERYGRFAKPLSAYQDELTQVIWEAVRA